MSPVNKDSVVFFLFNLYDFYFVYWSHYIVARTPGTMLKRDGKSGHPCLVLNLKGKTLGPFCR